jgi:glycerophosphoryl diester phosphodiesterase
MKRLQPALMILAVMALAWFAGCGDDDGVVADAGVGDGDVVDGAWPPPRADLAPPESYDCNAVGSPPDRVSSLPLGCFGDLACEGLVVVAHRGLGYLAPRNTLSAVRAAVIMGVDMIEVDVRLTSDGVSVLLHDSDVDSVTNGTGDIDAMTLAQAQALEVTPNGELVGDFSCERIPTFGEMLRLAAGRIDIMVDLKAGAAEAALVIEAEGMVSQAVMLGSQTELDEARAAVPDLRIMIRPLEHAEIQPLWDAYVPVPDVVHIDPGFDDPETIDLIHSLGAKVLME